MKGNNQSFLLVTAVIVLTMMTPAVSSLQKACYSPPLRKSECGFYTDCLELFYPCGPSGYAIGYGYKYCNKFSSPEFEECASSDGEEWMNSTLTCLQEALVPIIESDIEDISCLSIKLDAFDSHSICYTGGGEAVPTAPSICFLPPSDIACILATIDKEDLVSPLGLKEDMETALVCIAQHQSAGLCNGSTESLQTGSQDGHRRRCEYWRDRLRVAKDREQQLESDEERQ